MTIKGAVLNQIRHGKNTMKMDKKHTCFVSAKVVGAKLLKISNKYSIG